MCREVNIRANNPPNISGVAQTEGLTGWLAGWLGWVEIGHPSVRPSIHLSQDRAQVRDLRYRCAHARGSCADANVLHSRYPSCSLPVVQLIVCMWSLLRCPLSCYWSTMLLQRGGSSVTGVMRAPAVRAMRRTHLIAGGVDASSHISLR